MKKIIITMFSLAASIALSASAAGVPKPLSQMTAEEKAAQAKRIAEYKFKTTGGMLVKPGSEKGCIGIVNTQSEIPSYEIEPAFFPINRGMRLPIKMLDCKDGKPSATYLKDNKLNFAIFIVDDKADTHIVAIYPEECYATVNMAMIKSGVTKGALVERARKEVVRAFGLLCGAANTSKPGSIMGPTPSLEALDKILLLDYPTEHYAGTLGYLRTFGVAPRVEMSYDRACRQGWAPAPTNDVQKAIWDKVHAPPSNPIQIKFNPKTDGKEKE